MIPLDKTSGEAIEGLDDHYRVVSPALWRDTGFFEEAARAAERAFIASGAIGPLWFDEENVSVQQYDKTYKLAFLFSKRVAGKNLVYPYVFTLPFFLIPELEASGRWLKQPRTH